MNILLKVWGDGVENTDYALVTIEPAYALRMLQKVKLAQEIKVRYGHFHQLTFFECGPVLFGGELIGLETKERLVLDKPLFIPVDRQTMLDCVMLKVTHLLQFCCRPYGNNGTDWPGWSPTHRFTQVCRP